MNLGISAEDLTDNRQVKLVDFGQARARNFYRGGKQQQPILNI